jgi:tetratricopeptide (TPR) repeat protein
MNRRRIVLAALAPLLLLGPAWPARGADAPNPGKFAYESEDRDAAQRSFLEKLKQDKTKIDLAVENTKRLIDRSRQRPYLPELYLRLAELYVEKSRVVYFIRKTELPDGVKSLNSLESNTLKKQAIEVYHRILHNYPDFQERDKVLFFVAHEYRELGEIDLMVSRYEEIIRDYPRSRYAPEAHLLLGDHRFTAQDLDGAVRHYEAVLEHPDSPALAIARYKLAWCRINQRDFAGAARLFEAAVEASPAQQEVDIDTYRKVDIRLESLIDLAYCYGEEHKEDPPEAAIRYFEGYAWSRPALTTALEKLANRYFVKKKWEHSATVYRKLSTLQHDPEKLLEYAARVFECARALDTFADADRDMGLIIRSLKRQKYSVHIPAEEKEKNLRQYELYARDLVTHLHQRALEKHSPEDFRLAAAGYKAYLGFFSESEVRDEMRMNYAETLFSARDFVEAGRQFEAIAAEAPQSERDREENLYSAVLAYYSALQEKEGLSPYDKVFARAGLREVGKRYTAEYPTAKNVPKVLFNVAWVAYDEGNYSAAVQEFTRFVDTYPGTTEATAAVHLVLDAYNLTEDYEALVRFGRRVLGRADLDPRLQGEVTEIVQAAESKVLYPLALAAANDWQSGKEGLLQFAESQGSSALGEQALQAVVASASELHDLDTLFTSGAQLIDKYPQTAHLEETLKVLIDTSLKAAQFRRLVHFLEEFSRRLPKHASTPEFLLKAAQIRERLGEFKLASNDYTTLLAGPFPKGADVQAVVLSAAACARKGNDTGLALKVVLDNQDRLTGAERIRSDALAAQLYSAQGRADLGRRYRDRARVGYQKNVESSDAALVEAVGEMEFQSLEADFGGFMALQLGSDIDDGLVQKKGDLYGVLLKGYHKLMQMQSPRWALAACFRASQINAEFARFLKEAPLPELPEEQRQQYTAIVAEKARGYAAKGEEYRQKCAELARKWEICDAELAPYFLASAPLGGATARATGTAVDGDWLSRADLKAAHLRVLQELTDLAGMNDLATRYLRLGDYRLAILVAETALEQAEQVDPATRAALYNTLGVAHCYSGEDPLAKDAFQKALAQDPEHLAARINLAGLFQEYGHAEKAQALYAGIGLNRHLDGDRDLIHPRAQELYHAFASSASL